MVEFEISLIKALATIVFELESVNYVRLDGDPSVYAELLQNKAEPKMFVFFPSFKIIKITLLKGPRSSTTNSRSATSY